MLCVNCQTTLISYFTKKGFIIKRCPNCALMAVANVPADLSPFYSEGYFKGDTSLDGYMDYDREKEASKSTYLNFLKAIERALGDGEEKKMLEVGCATGYFMILADTRGWKPEGIDLSEYAVKRAQAAGLRVSVAAIENYVGSGKFNAVVMQDVIEHVKDPVLVISKAWNLLEPNGVLAISTPDAGSLWARVWKRRWHAFVPPQHLFYFSGRNLSQMLEKQNFTVLELSHHGKRFTVPYILRMLCSWTGLKFLSKIAEWASRTWLKNVIISINVGDTIFLIARKNNI